MVLMMVRQEAGPRERWPKTLKGELENSSRPGWKSGIVTLCIVKKVQLTLSRGTKKKEDEVEDEDDDDVVRTSVSQDKVTATLCTEKLLLSTQYM
jgi:hypothetical protein